MLKPRTDSKRKVGMGQITQAPIKAPINRVRPYFYALYKGACAIWDNSYFAFGSYARFKPRNIEFCNLTVYLIIIMLFYLGLYGLIVFLCWREI